MLNEVSDKKIGKKGVAVIVDLSSGSEIVLANRTDEEADSTNSLQNSFKRFRDQKIRERKLLQNMQRDR